MLLDRDGPYRRLQGALPRRQKRQLVLVLALMLVGGLAEMLTIGALIPFLVLLSGGELGDWPALAALFGPMAGPDRGPQLAIATLVFAGAAVAATGLRLLLLWSTERVAFDVGHHLVVEIHRRVLHQPYAWHVRRHSSELIASLAKVETLTAGVLLQLLQAAGAVVIAAFILAALLAAAPAPAVGALVLFGSLYWLLGRLAHRRLRRNSAALEVVFDHRVRLIQDHLGAIRDVILDRSQAACLGDFERVDRQLADAQATTAFIAAAPRFLVEATGLIAIALAAILLAGGEGGLPAALPTLGVIALGAQRLLPLFQQLYRAQAVVAGNRGIASQIADLLALPLPAAADPEPDPLPFSRAIECTDLRFAYPGRDHPAIDGVSLTVPRGARVALTGPTGAGKSTLADLLMGLIEPDSGTIAVDGTPLDAGSRPGWYRNIAHVPQAAFLASDSIARNIAFASEGAPIDMERVRGAARIAQLDSFVDSLPGGYETRVGERGVQLSGGQRQRLALARAIYKRTPVLILDEATSALDDATEAAVLDALDELTRAGVTIVVIAHRDSTIARCNQVIRLDQGRLVEG